VKFVAYFLTAFLSIVFAQSFTYAELSAAPLQNLSVTEATFDFTVERDHSFIITLGSIKNTSPVCFDNVVVEVKYFDGNKKLIDTITQSLYDIVVPASGEVAFRVRDAAAKSKDLYVTQNIRVVSAEPREPDKKTISDARSQFIDIFLSWVPILLLIGVWIYFILKFRGKGSAQERSLMLMQQQNAILEAQSGLLERLAKAIEARGK
jgi:ATP-dependent Zn protease